MLYSALRAVKSAVSCLYSAPVAITKYRFIIIISSIIGLSYQVKSADSEKKKLFWQALYKMYSTLFPIVGGVLLVTVAYEI